MASLAVFCHDKRHVCFENMYEGPLQNYLRTHRRKAGLSQDELAFLLGVETGTAVSRYESGRRTPGLLLALAYEAVFGISGKELFAGEFFRVEAEVKERAQRLLAKVDDSPTRENTRKLELLAGIAQDGESIVVPLWPEEL